MISLTQADRMYNTAVSTRGNTNQHWTECAEISSPRDRLFNESQTEGTKLRMRQFDSTIEHIHDRSTNYFISLTTPKHQEYFGLTSLKDVEDEGRLEEQEALEEDTRTIFDARYRPKAKFDETRFNTTRSFLGFGNGCMFIDKGPDRETPITYHFCHLANTHFIVDGLDNIKGVFYSRRMESHQIVQEFGEDNVPEKIKVKSLRETDIAMQENKESFTVVHMVLENEDYHPKKRGIKFARYISRHFVSSEKGMGDVFMRQGGYRVMPYAIVRDAHMPHEIYGRGTLQKILPEIKMRNIMRRNYIEASHRAGRSTLLFKDNSSINMSQVRPGAGIIGGLDESNNPTVKALDQGDNIPVLKEALDETERIAHQAFNMDLYISNLDQDRDRITATEILTRTQEQARAVSYHAGLDEDQMQNSIVTREIDILDHDWNLMNKYVDQNELGEEELSQIPSRVFFKSQMTFAQKSDDVISITRTAEFMQVFTQFDPTAKHAMNIQRSMDIVSEANGTPARAMSTPAEFKALVKADQDKELAMSAMQNSAGLASAVGILEGSPDEGAL